MSSPSRHLDLGSGPVPRNPLGAREVVGLDLRGAKTISESSAIKVMAWNAVSEKIPFPDQSFSSCSAFDFLEHVPRVWPAGTGADVSFPFVELMSEIHRVLRPGGLFLAASPVYPTVDAFTDPTHVNFLTKESHRYFCGSDPWARAYGFRGRFHPEMIEIGLPHFLYSVLPSVPIRRAKVLWRRILGQQPTHLLWRLRADK
jgi:SAM-dependent methyltransferase